MATTKISALPAATTADAADLTIVVTDIGAGALQDQKATVTQAATYSRALTSATTASAIVGSGSSLIINTALADSDTRIAGTTSATLFFVDAGLDKVGIATAVPTQKLDVTGTVNATLFAGSGASLTGLGTTSTAFRTVATDPSPLVAGDVWYNSTSDAFKCAQASNWSAGGALPSNRKFGGAAGTTTASVRFGGEYDASNLDRIAYLYNGTTWSSTGSTTQTPGTKGVFGCGTSTAALMAQGVNNNPTPGFTDVFNGSTWSSLGAASANDRQNPSSAGTSTAALTSGGGSSTLPNANAQKFNGTVWSSTGSLTTSRWKAAGGCSGTDSSTLTVGGENSLAVALSSCESFNGSTWSSATSLPATMSGGSTFGSSSTSVIADKVDTYAYNGTTWATMTHAAAYAGSQAVGTGSGTSGMIIGGGNSGIGTDTWIYSSTGTATKTFTVA